MPLKKKKNNWASLVAQTVKNLPAMQETWVRSLGWDDPLEEAWQPTPVFLPREFHGQRSLVGYSPWVRKESDMTDELTLSLAHLTDYRIGSTYLLYPLLLLLLSRFSRVQLCVTP